MQCLEQIILTNQNAVRLAAAGKPIKAATSNALTLALVVIAAKMNLNTRNFNGENNET